MFSSLMDGIYFKYSRNLMLSFKLSKSPFIKTLSASVSRFFHGTFRLRVGGSGLSSLSSEPAGRDLTMALTFWAALKAGAMQGCEKPFMWPQERTPQRPACVEGNLGARQKQGSRLLEASDKVSFLGAGSCALKQTKPQVWLCSLGFAFSGNVLLYQAVLETSKILVCRRTLEQFLRDFCVRSSQLRKGPLTTSVFSLFPSEWCSWKERWHHQLCFLSFVSSSVWPWALQAPSLADNCPLLELGEALELPLISSSVKWVLKGFPSFPEVLNSKGSRDEIG